MHRLRKGSPPDTGKIEWTYLFLKNTYLRFSVKISCNLKKNIQRHTLGEYEVLFEKQNHKYAGLHLQIV